METPGSGANSEAATPKQLEGCTAIFRVATTGCAQAIMSLVDQKVPVDVHGRSGWTPLLAAVAKGMDEAVRMLLSLDADPNSRNDHDSTALSIAAERGGCENGLSL